MFPGFLGVGLLRFRWLLCRMRIILSQYPRAFHRKVLDLLEPGQPVKHVADNLGLSEQAVYYQRTHDAIDQGTRPNKVYRVI